MKSFKVLGINYGAHDTSAAIGVSGELIAACEQERYDLSKHSRNFPKDAIEECLKISKIKLNNIDEIAVATDFKRLVKETYLRPALKEERYYNFFINNIDSIKKIAGIEEEIRSKLNFKNKIKFYDHHLCHLSSAYFPSGFKNALLYSNDGKGEIESSMLGVGDNGKIKVLEKGPRFPDSLGLVYAAITTFLGWKYCSDEGIVMGLAPLGNYNDFVKGTKKTYLQIFREIILKKKGIGYKINLDWISYHYQRDTWVSEKFLKIFGPRRKSEATITTRDKNIAAALQKRIEEITIGNLKYAKKKYKKNQLCIAGGVGLNCSLNGKIINSGIFKEVFVQPASGDAGNSIGAVFCSMSNMTKNKLIIKKRLNYYLGADTKDSEIVKQIKKHKLKYYKSKNIYRETARLLAEGKIIAWHQGRAEFGPRALGNRSILCKPYPVSMKDYINSKVKFREAFRPFAPAVLEECQQSFFDLKQKSFHMLVACNVKKKLKHKIPATVHTDNTCRIQTVTKLSNLKFYNLITEFYKLTGCPVLLNTSFNIKGQPMVNNANDAILTFKRTKIDVLVIGNNVLKKL